MQCDESCDIEGRASADWSDSAGAPQWAEIGAPGMAILLLTGLAVFLASSGRGRAAVAVVCLHAVASVRLGLLLATAQHGADWWSWLLLAPATRGRGGRGRDAGGRAVQRVARPVDAWLGATPPLEGSPRPTLVACVTRSR